MERLDLSGKTENLDNLYIKFNKLVDYSNYFLKMK